jgi:hypothetical protein
MNIRFYFLKLFNFFHENYVKEFWEFGNRDESFGLGIKVFPKEIEL